MAGTPIDALIAREDWPRAEAALRRAAARRGAPAGVFYNLALVLERRGKGAQAGTWLRRAVSADPGHGKAWFELGRRAVAEDAPAAACEAFARAAGCLPGDADSLRNLARLALQLGRWREAGRAFAALEAPVP